MNFEGHGFTGTIEASCVYFPERDERAFWVWKHPLTGELKFDIPTCQAFCPKNPIKPKGVQWDWDGSVRQYSY